MRFRTQIAMGISDTAELCLKNGGILLAKSIACSFMALTATKEQLLFGKGGLSQPIVARRGSPGDFANSVRSFLILWDSIDRRCSATKCGPMVWCCSRQGPAPYPAAVGLQL